MGTPEQTVLELVQEALAEAKSIKRDVAMAMEEDFRNVSLDAKYRKAVLHVETLEELEEQVKRLVRVIVDMREELEM